MYNFCKDKFFKMRVVISLVLVIMFMGCNNTDGPDISNIKADLKTQRFERDLFETDTNNIEPGVQRLMAKYPAFGVNFFETILNTDSKWSKDTTTQYIKGFITAFRSVYDSSQDVFKNFEPYEKQIEKAVKYLKYYFPNYKPPGTIITYIGPLNGFGDILTEDAFIVGLHHHLGENFSMYKSMYVHETYPGYISNRFQPSYIVVNCMKNIVNDIYPENEADRSLVIQMVEKGKRLYMLSKLLPGVAEHKLIGYTEKQLKDSYAHEKIIWDLFIQNNFLQTSDNNIIKNYVGESPKTMELGEASPGNIGSFSGWQVVKTYMKKNSAVTLPELMKTDAEEVFQKAKYKP
jgi:hypothetical protein